MQMIERHAAGLPEPTPAPGQGRASKNGGKQGGKEDEGPKLQSVGSLSSASEQAIRNALHRNKSDEALYSEEAAAAAFPSGGGGAAAAEAITAPDATTVEASASAAGSDSATRPYFCATCGVQASSAVSYQDHCKGKKHLAAVRRNPPPPLAATSEAAPADTGSPGGDAISKGNNSTQKKDSDKRGRRANSGPPPLSLKPPPMLQDMGPLTAQRKALPVFGYREELLRTIEHNQVVVVEGETGELLLRPLSSSTIPFGYKINEPQRMSSPQPMLRRRMSHVVHVILHFRFFFFFLNPHFPSVPNRKVLARLRKCRTTS
jgi:hypothetical protein